MKANPKCISQTQEIPNFAVIQKKIETKTEGSSDSNETQEERTKRKLGSIKMAAMSGHTAARPMSLVDCYVITEFWFLFFFTRVVGLVSFFLGGFSFLSFVSLGSGFRRDRMTRRRDAVTGPFDVAAA